jgi:predicted lipoprotein with Yx(FWY)xxD motif
MKSKSLKTFIKENRPEIDAAIRSVAHSLVRNDDDRKEWILNHEPLYRWARSWGWKG